jgi:hypothetical protein
MKKSFVIIVLMTLCTQMFGQELVDTHLSINKEYLFDMSSTNLPLTLTPFSDTGVTKAEDRKWVAFVLNLVLGFGIGSFVQGDTFGGIVGLVGDLGGLALFYSPYFYFLINFMDAIDNREIISLEDYKKSLWIMAGGLVVLTLTHVFEVVRPFKYADKFSVAVTPTMTGQPALTAMVKIKL